MDKQDEARKLVNALRKDTSMFTGVALPDGAVQVHAARLGIYFDVVLEPNYENCCYYVDTQFGGLDLYLHKNMFAALTLFLSGYNVKMNRRLTKP